MPIDRGLVSAETALGETVALDDFITWTEWALARVGFRPLNCLPVVAVCRDELMSDVDQAIEDTWGRAFRVGSLGGMVLAGRTGMAAALGHVPGEDGRHRFVIFCLPHIGVDAAGRLGRVQRRGMYRDSTACGALAEVLSQMSDDPGAVMFDPDDVEMSLLRERVVAVHASEGTPDLVSVTEAARCAAVADVRRYIALVESEEPVDVAYVSGIVVHLPDGSDRVAGVEADVVIDGFTVPLPH